MRFKVRYSCTSHIGMCRKTNQDNYVCQDRLAKLEDKREYPLVGSFPISNSELIGVF